MTDSQRFWVPFLIVLMTGVAPSPLIAGNIKADLSPYIAPEKIAIDPVLLQTKDVESPDFRMNLDRFSPESPHTKNDSPTADTAAISRTSALEDIYSTRLRAPIRQFGYDSIGPVSSGQTAGRGAVQDSYILQAGDEVSLLIRGNTNQSTPVVIGDDGSLIIDNLPPISAAGKSVSAVRQEITALLKDVYNTDVFLSITKTRQIAVTVAGNVAHPGQVTLSTYNTVLDALGSAGGVQKTGSLRQISLIRNHRTQIIDLYGVLVYGSGSADLSLRDGDRITVPPIGPTLAIAGATKRPAIYEILPAILATGRTSSAPTPANSQTLSLNDLLDLSGGAVLPAKTRYIRLNLANRAADSVSEITNFSDRLFADGDILMIRQADPSGDDLRHGTIELKGASPQAGLFALTETPSLSALLTNDSLLSNTVYPLIGVIERRDPKHLSKELIAFSPLQILAKKHDVALRESDVVTLFSRDDVAHLKPPEDIDAPVDTPAGISGDPPAPSPADMTDELKNFLIEHAVFVRGSIRAAGSYPIAESTSLDELLAIAGGASLEANTRSVEITHTRGDTSTRRNHMDLATTPAALITLHAGDTIRIGQNFKRIEDRHVTLTGEVKNPGSYDLIAGDTLGSLIKRAGGLTEQAYPQGAIFSRKSERLREEQRYKSQARGLEFNLAAALQSPQKDTKPNDQELALARNLIAELKGAEALGRITVQADPAILATHPDQDILLESSDKIYIPKRPLTVRVAGEVLSPASLQFRSGKSPHDYINEAGGFAYNADQDRAFVVYPDGSAQPLSVSAWNYQATLIPPGSTIIVPQDPKPLTFMDGAKDLSQILANLATTAIFAEDITDGN